MKLLILVCQHLYIRSSRNIWWHLIGCHNTVLKPIVLFCITYGFVQLGDTSTMGDAHMLKSLLGVLSEGCLFTFHVLCELRGSWNKGLWLWHGYGSDILLLLDTSTEDGKISNTSSLSCWNRTPTNGDTQIWRCLPPTNCNHGQIFPFLSWKMIKLTSK